MPSTVSASSFVEYPGSVLRGAATVVSSDSGSYLAVPLLDDQRLLGAVVAFRQAIRVSSEDERCLGRCMPS
jgi:GAF domain-containing protein